MDRRTRACDHRHRAAGKAVRCQQAGRDIDRDAHHQPALAPVLHVGQRPGQDGNREIIDPPGFLDQRDEAVGRQHSAQRVLPAHQRLDRVDMAGLKVELGLIGHAHIAIAQRIVELAQQRELLARRFTFAVGMEPPGLARALGKAGSMGSVAGRVGDVGRRDPEGQRYAKPAPGHFERAAHHRLEPGQQLFELFKRERAGPYQRAGVDAVDRLCIAGHLKALDQTAQQIAEVLLAHRQLERIEFVDLRSEAVSLARIGLAGVERELVEQTACRIDPARARSLAQGQDCQPQRASHAEQHQRRDDLEPQREGQPDCKPGDHQPARAKGEAQQHPAAPPRRAHHQRQQRGQSDRGRPRAIDRHHFGESLGGHEHLASRHRPTMRRGFGRHVDHPGPARLVEVSEGKRFARHVVSRRSGSSSARGVRSSLG